MNRTVHVAAAFAALLIGVLACLLWREHRAMVVVRTEAARTAVLSKQIENLERALLAARRLAEAKNLSGDAASDKTSPPTPTAPRVLSETDRQIRARMLLVHRWTELGKRADIVAGLNLPPEKLAQFKDLLVERYRAESDARDAASAAGANSDSAAAAEVEKITQQIKALLGDDDFQRFSELSGTQFFRESLEQSPALGFFVDAGVPLSNEQKNFLAQSFYRAFLVQSRDYNGQPEEIDPATGFKPSQNLILEQTAQTLSPSQLAALRNYFQSDNQLGELMKASPSRRGPP